MARVSARTILGWGVLRPWPTGGPEWVLKRDGSIWTGSYEQATARLKEKGDIERYTFRQPKPGEPSWQTVRVSSADERKWQRIRRTPMHMRNPPKRDVIGDKIRILMAEGYPHRQAIAIALSMQRRGELGPIPARRNPGTLTDAQRAMVVTYHALGTSPKMWRRIHKQLRAQGIEPAAYLSDAGRIQPVRVRENPTGKRFGSVPDAFTWAADARIGSEMLVGTQVAGTYGESDSSGLYAWKKVEGEGYGTWERDGRLEPGNALASFAYSGSNPTRHNRDGLYVRYRHADTGATGMGDIQFYKGEKTGRDVLSAMQHQANMEGKPWSYELVDGDGQVHFRTCGVDDHPHQGRTMFRRPLRWNTGKALRGRPNERVDVANLNPEMRDRLNPIINRYQAMHWGNKATKIYDIKDDLLPDMAQMGRLVSVWVVVTDGENTDKMDLKFGPDAHLGVEQNHPVDRLHLIVPPKMRAQLAREVAKGNPDRIMSLGKLAKRVGGKQAGHGYPNLQGLAVGEVTHIIYATHKKGDGPSHYIHQFSEESHGPLPWLSIDQEGRPWLIGGSYTVPDGGITD